MHLHPREQLTTLTLNLSYTNPNPDASSPKVGTHLHPQKQAIPNGLELHQAMAGLEEGLSPHPTPPHTRAHPALTLFPTPPHTRAHPALTLPPNPSTRFLSRGTLGLWSSVKRRASLLRHSTARLSPACAAYSMLPAHGGGGRAGGRVKGSGESRALWGLGSKEGRAQRSAA
jgi:hypothetical protein